MSDAVISVFPLYALAPEVFPDPEEPFSLFAKYAPSLDLSKEKKKNNATDPKILMQPSGPSPRRS
jgi:hypothetical protein